MSSPRSPRHWGRSPMKHGRHHPSFWENRPPCLAAMLHQSWWLPAIRFRSFLAFWCLVVVSIQPTKSYTFSGVSGWVGGLGWVGLGWVGLGWVGLGWVGLGWGDQKTGSPEYGLCLLTEEEQKTHETRPGGAVGGDEAVTAGGPKWRAPLPAGPPRRAV